MTPKTKDPLKQLYNKIMPILDFSGFRGHNTLTSQNEDIWLTDSES